jgi:hypothetical protein
MKLVENIRAVETGKRRIIEEPLHKITYTADKDYVELMPKSAKEYSITVTLGANQWIAEELIEQSKGEVIEFAVEQMKRDIIEHVYGEIRKDLMDLHMTMRHEINHYDSQSLKKLEKIVDKITL